MPIEVAYNDEIRLKVLDSLFKKGAIKPDIPRICDLTGLNIKEVRKIIKFFEDDFGLEYSSPALNSHLLGFNFLGWVFFQMDLSKKDTFNDFMEYCKKQPWFVMANKVLGSGKWNFAIRFTCKTIEEFDEMLTEQLAFGVKGLHDLILAKEYFFFKEAFNKDVDFSVSLVWAALENEDEEYKALGDKSSKAKVLECLTNGEGLKPNIRHIKKLTGLHSATIKSSLNFLVNQKVILAYYPCVDISKIRTRFFVFDFLKIDTSDVDVINALKEISMKEKKIFRAGLFFGNPDHNAAFIQPSGSVELYMENFEKRYYSTPGLKNYFSHKETIFSIPLVLESGGCFPTQSSLIIKRLVYESGKEFS
jgi:hypothetical protein